MLPSWADVDTDDTILDESTGSYFAIEDIADHTVAGVAI